MNMKQVTLFRLPMIAYVKVTIATNQKTTSN
jgi:hypothetical protein